MSVEVIHQAESPLLEDEYALWDWVRTAGVSARELREALLRSMPGVLSGPKAGIRYGDQKP